MFHRTGVLVVEKQSVSVPVMIIKIQQIHRSAFTGNAIGALTYSFVQAVQSARKLTYGDLLDNMRKVVREAQQQQGLNAPFASSTSQVICLLDS
ncbi:hypothetical protein Tco_0821676 [Tanacetum coccineum]|uniref:Uncharacterized protein n=1 Tax=Tanacetum coccineum TaxID=301880 RepID=A0ABQ5AG23_9ASTR